MSGYKTPPQGDFRSFAKLASEQSVHMGKLGNWTSVQCSSTGGFEGLLLPMKALVPDIANLFTPKMAQCQRGMTDVAHKVGETADEYAKAEDSATDSIRNIYPGELPHFPDFGTLGLPDIGDFTDEPVSLREPQSGAADTAQDIKHQLQTLRNGFSSGPLATAEKVFKFCTGQSLVGLLIEPIAGEYGQLKYLEDAYDTLSQGLYTVAATVRKSSWKLGDEWTGDAAASFDSYMFRWNMGIGGLGDAAKVVSQTYRDLYAGVVVLVHKALAKINTLVNNELEQLVEQGAELAEGDAAIETVGLGPEDPIADIGAGVYSAYKLYKIYKIVANIITAINAIIAIYHAISKLISDVPKAIHAVQAAFDAGLPSIGSLVDDAEQRGFSFEENSHWDPNAGAVRIALLPSA